MGKSLWSITEDMQALDDLFEEVDQNMDDPKVVEALKEWNEDNNAALEDKADGYAAYIGQLLATAEARKEEAKRLKALAESDENTAKRLKENLKSVFQLRGIKKLETARYKLGVQKNGGKQSLEVDIPAEKLAECFQKVTVTADNDEIRTAIAAGEEIEGCRLLPRGESLRIR